MVPNLDLQFTTDCINTYTVAEKRVPTAERKCSQGVHLENIEHKTSIENITIEKHMLKCRHRHYFMK